MSLPLEKKLPSALIVRDKEAESYWQPKPANGYINIHAAPDLVKMEMPIAMGTQTVAKDCFVREHAHNDRDEIIHFVSGCGQIIMDDVSYDVEAGDSLFIGRNHKHKFIANQGESLTFFWVILPNGLESFFRQIGRPRSEEETPPSPFERPENIAQIERDTVFADLTSSEVKTPNFRKPS